ncbi:MULTISPECIES: thiamine pyrophosphate-binding protein [unclassified Mesorhizobium]|uniref:thiamine pyrophosphate-binding protein n=1 Tax=unclassified Mesorhizobium TaxID=325217 RepID=UPI00112ADA88|nr:MULTISPECIES: thiamine pyrophosphate-binding protein [unclassified Mesorhizobium]TPL00757.1 thiamine pyrophosphate-binding protein [Mesorhizobium sp. B2-4-16]TPL76982.1 thiamine pyrophosphate-binding protein [Mesorhizobium sp. B2-4-3]
MTIIRTGGQILVDHLVSEGVDRIFCVPGESYLAVLDALHDSGIDIVVCRQEGGAAMMAEAYGKLTGKPGVCFVTRGPGATNASAGIHVAQQDATPMLLFVGQVERGFIGREAFQEVDYRAAFSPLAKWATEIEDTNRIGEVVSRAFHYARSGRPGPVVVALPEDILTEASQSPAVPPASEAIAWPAPQQIERLSALLAGSKRPAAILGGSRWSASAVRHFTNFAENFDLPVAVTSRRQMLFSSDHSNFVGDIGVGPNPALLELIGKSDLILLVGDRLSEIPSQSYSLITPNDPRGLVHVFPDANELGRFYRPTLPIACGPIEFAEAVSELRPSSEVEWSHITKDARSAYLAYSDPTDITIPGQLQMGEVMKFLRERLPANAIVCNGAGNYTAWVHRFYRFREFGTQLAPTSGSMGYGVPAAVSAKITNPDRMVIAFAGDGCFLMHGQEFATAVQYNASLIVIVVDNSMYGTIRMHQERNYPGRVTGTQLRNPDFAAYARTFGGHGETVRSTSEFAQAFERAVASGIPSILHCIIDPEAITPTMTLSQITEHAKAVKNST